MTLAWVPGRFSVVKVRDFAGADLSAPFVFAASTDREKSLVAREEALPGDCLAREDGFSLMRVKGTLDFSLVGVLSRLSGALAGAGVGLFALSTFDTDYLLVREADREKAENALMGAGYRFAPD